MLIFRTRTWVILEVMSPPSDILHSIGLTNMVLICIIKIKYFFLRGKKVFSEKKNIFFCLSQLILPSIERQKKLQLQFTYNKSTELRKVRCEVEFSTLVVFPITEVELCDIAFIILFLYFCC